MRRNDSTGELAFYRCYSPQPVPLGALVRVAGRRWTVDESFQTAKGQAGLDQHQVRTWTSWHRWVTLAMLAMAFLAVVTADERDHTPAPAGMIPFTLNEIRRLFDALTTAPRQQQSTSSIGPTGAETQAIARESTIAADQSTSDPRTTAAVLGTPTFRHVIVEVRSLDEPAATRPCVQRR